MGGDSVQQPIHPLDVVIDAWNQTCQEKITGSCTICVATLDAKSYQLLYTNLGDCGLMVLRHIDSEIAGYMRERNTPRHMRTHDLRIAYLSQQQLRSFNLPYQLGFSDLPQHPGAFGKEHPPHQQCEYYYLTTLTLILTLNLSQYS